MYHKKSDLKGDLYLVLNIKFPKHSWLEEKQVMTKLRELLPLPDAPIESDVIDEVTYEETANLEDFGTGAEGSETWVDEDAEEEGPQCAQQ